MQSLTFFDIYFSPYFSKELSNSRQKQHFTNPELGLKVSVVVCTAIDGIFVSSIESTEGVLFASACM